MCRNRGNRCRQHCYNYADHTKLYSPRMAPLSSKLYSNETDHVKLHSTKSGLSAYSSRVCHIQRAKSLQQRSNSNSSSSINSEKAGGNMT
jgi:hypothetical protein